MIIHQFFYFGIYKGILDLAPNYLKRVPPFIIVYKMISQWNLHLIYIPNKFFFPREEMNSNPIDNPHKLFDFV